MHCAVPSLIGQLLVASPHLRGDFFARTVVLILQHGEEGALGLVLNRPTNQTLDVLWQQVSQQPCPRQEIVHVGGPVSGPLMAVHLEKTLAELEVPLGLCIAVTREHLEELVKHSEQPLRLFIGHAGWGAGQLENELSSGVWLTAPATLEHVFGEHGDLWKDTVDSIGRRFFREHLGIKHLPDDVSLN